MQKGQTYNPCVKCVTVISRRGAASLWPIIGAVIQQQTRFQLLNVKCKPHTSLQISLVLPPHGDDVGCYDWNTTSPVCRNFCKTHNHGRSLRLIIQYIFFSHCLFPVKESSYLSGWQCTVHHV